MRVNTEPRHPYLFRDADGNEREVEIGWGFNYPYRLVEMAYNIYRNSGFVVLPHPQDLERYDEYWLADIATMHAITEHKKPDDNVGKDQSDGQATKRRPNRKR